ncbi:MAG: hypothetical protein M3O62_05770 [Pseudomonadota bacterium]|nr:hypothetical protein [Pseudomonadota bacterium]
MNAAMTLERRQLEARSRHYQKEMRLAASGLRSSVQLAPHALTVARRLAPALPYVVAAVAVGAVVMQLRARNTSRLLLIGGLLFDALRVWSLRRQNLPVEVALKAPDRAPVRDPASVAAAQ